MKAYTKSVQNIYSHSEFLKNHHLGYQPEGTLLHMTKYKDSSHLMSAFFADLVASQYNPGLTIPKAKITTDLP